METAFLK